MPEPSDMDITQTTGQPAGSATLDLQLLAEQKEREWRHVQQLRYVIRSLVGVNQKPRNRSVN